MLQVFQSDLDGDFGKRIAMFQQHFWPSSLVGVYNDVRSRRKSRSVQ